MNLEIFFEKFELFADMPDAIIKMRELVLQLAVQGRLVQQSSVDEPADILASLISRDRADFIATNNLARQRVFTAVDSDKYPFALPSNWEWAYLGNLCRVQAGFAFQSSAFVQGDSGVPLIRIRDITQVRTQVNYVGEYREEFLVEPGDYLVGMDGNFTVAKWMGPRALLNQRVSRLQWFSRYLEPSFFAVALQHRLSELQGTKAYTTVDHLSSGQIEDAVVPLPPLAEQKRIVVKVNELMALCDRLEAQQKEREGKANKLTRTSLARFADAPTPANLNMLFHKSYSIGPADLRKTILSLAVRGKLVLQESNDESADISIARVKKDAMNAISEGIIGRHGSVEKADKREMSILPYGWRWTRLVEVTRPVQYAIKRGPFGSAIRKDMFVPSGYKIYEQQHAIYGDFTKGHYYIDEAKFNELKAFEIHPGEIIVSCSGTVGKVSIVPPGIERGIINQALLKLSLHQGALLNEYFLILFPAFFMETDTLSNLSGTAQKNIPGMDVLKALPFPLPPLSEQVRIVKKINDLMVLVDTIDLMIEDCAQKGAKLLEAVVEELTRGK